MHVVCRNIIKLALIFQSLSLLALPTLPTPQSLPTIQGDPAILNKWSPIAKDDRGRVCFSVKKLGLHCYDGVDLQIVFEQEIVGLQRLNISSQSSQLHFAGPKTLYTYFNGQVTKVQLNGGFELAPNERVQHLFPIDKLTYFISTNHALYQYKNNDVVKVYSYKSFSDERKIAYAKKINKNTIQLGTSNGLVTIDLAFVDNDKGKGVIREEYKGLFIRHFYDQYVLTDSGVYFREEKISNKKFFQAYKRRNGDVLAVGRSGICRLKEASISCRSKPVHAVYTVFEDEFETLWFSSSKGIKYAPDTAINYLTTNNGMLSNNIPALEAGESSIFMGTSNGVNRLDLSSQELHVLNETKGIHVVSLLLLDGRLWIASSQSELFIYDLNSSVLTDIGKVKGNIMSMANFADSIFVATQYSGIYQYSQDGKLIKRNEANFISQVRKITACGDFLVVGTTNNGLIRINHQNEVHDYSNKKNYSIFSCDHNDISTRSTDGRMLTLDTNLLRTNNLDEDFQIPTLTSLIQGQNSIIWAVHDNGIVKFQNKRFIKSYQTEPLIYLYNNSIVRHANLLFLGGVAGLAVIDLDKLENQQNNPPVIMINSFESNGSLIIEPRIDNQALSEKLSILYKQAHQESFRILRWGENIVFHSMPKSSRIDLKIGGFSDNKFVSKSVSIENYASFFDKSTASSNFQESTKLYTITVVLLTLSIALPIALLLIRFTPKILAFGKKPSSGSETGPKARDNYSDNKNNFGLFYDKEAFHQRQVSIQKGTTRYGNDLYKVLNCNKLLIAKGRITSPQELASELGLEVKELSAALRKIFGCGKIRIYVDVFLDYVAEQGLESVQTSN